MGMSLSGKACLCALLMAWSAAAAVAAADADVALLEEEINAIKEARESAVKVSGYVDAEYIVNADDNKAHGFRIHHLSVFLSKQFTRDWKFFSELEYEDAPKVEVGKTTEGKIFAEAINIDYQWTPSHYVRIGRFFTPAGIWSVDHYPPYVPTQERPMHIRNLFPQIADGVDAHGTVPLGTTFMNYAVYVANGESTKTGAGDTNDNKAMGARVSFIIPALKYLELGLSGFKDTDSSNMETTALGVHGKLKVQDVTLQAEYAQDDEKPQTGAKTEKIGYYLQVLYDISRWTVGYRYDFYDKNKSAKVDVTRNSVFANYHVNPSIVWKLEHHTIDNQDATVKDYGLTIASIAYYLGD